VRYDYDNLLDGMPYYRDIHTLPDKELRKVRWGRCDLAHSLSKTRYLPEQMSMPTFIEGPVASASLFQELAYERGVSMDAIHEYFLRAFFSRRITVGQNPAFSDLAWQELVDADIVVIGADIPLDALIPTLSMAEIRTSLNHLGQRQAATKVAARASLVELSEDDEDRVLEAVRTTRDWGKVFCINPPPGHDWLAFQSIRQQIKGMAVALADVYDGTLKSKSKQDFEMLCA